MNAVPCPICGHAPELPRITPEMLYFRSTQSELPKLGATMPDGCYAVAFAGVIYAMKPEDWAHYERMQRACERLDNRLTKEAA